MSGEAGGTPAPEAPEEAKAGSKPPPQLPSSASMEHRKASRWFWFASQQGVLLQVIVAEVVIFSITGTNFLSLTNGFEILRSSLEIGLLAVALTPVIVTGGIDLSVGSLMGLSAITLGKLWRDAHWPMGAAIAGTLLLGMLAGWMNAWLITRLRIPPLIVTLGSFSLFRGLAEGITQAVDNFTGFADSFVALGQGYLFGQVPIQ